MASDIPQIPAEAGPKIIDVDARKSDYTPTPVRMRGIEYLFGRSLAGVMGATSLFEQARENCTPEGSKEADGVKFTGALAGLIPQFVGLLCPELSEVELTVDEQAALIDAIGEVLRRSQEIRFSA